MFKKSLGKKLIAFVLAGCMVLPAVGYLGKVINWEALSKVDAAITSYSVLPVTVASTTSPSGYYTRSYYEVSSDSLLGTDSSSPFYTKYRKSQYYLLGDTGDGSGGISGSNAGYVYKRYNADGTRVTTLKNNPNAELGSKDNPCVILEIVPDEMAGQFGFMVRGQEFYDQTYCNLFTDTNNASFQGLASFGNITQEKIVTPTSWGTNTFNTGLYYGSNPYTKEVLGFGYHDQELAQAPEIDKYTFCGWYVSDGINEHMFDVDHLVENINWWSFGDTTNKDLHVYARWQYQAYDNDVTGNISNPDDSAKVLKAMTTYMTIDDSQTFTVTSQNGVANKVTAYVTGAGNDSLRTFKSITFHYALPKGEFEIDIDGDGKIDYEDEDTDTDNDGLKGEYEKINIAPKAPVSFAHDYNFNNVICLKSGNYAEADWSAWHNNNVMWYPSLMGNTDYNVLKYDGNVQVITIPASEFKTGPQATYEAILDSVDLIFVADVAYSDSCKDPYFLAMEVGANNDVKKDAYANMLRSDANKTIKDTAITPSGMRYITGLTLEDTDLEAYVVKRLWKNMAADNSLGKIIPVLTQSTLLNSNNKLNVKKFNSLVASNEFFEKAYTTWGSRISIKPAPYGDYPGYPASANTLVLKDFADKEITTWDVAGGTFYPYDGLVQDGSRKWTSTIDGWVNIPGSNNNNVDYMEAGSEYEKIFQDGWLYNTILNGTGLHNVNTGLTTSYMLYNSDTSLMQQFLGTGTFNDANPWNEQGYEFLHEEGVIPKKDPNTVKKITTGLAIHSLLFSGGGKKDAIIIDNYTSSYSDTNSGENLVYVINDFTGIGSTKLLYHMDTNFGTEYYMEYYKIKDTGNFKQDYANAIASSNADKLDLSGPDPTDTAGIRTYGRIDGTTDLNMSDIKEIKSFTYTASGGTEITIPKTVELLNEGPTPDKRPVGVLLNSTGVDATHKDRYVIVARHNDGRFIAYAYVEVSISNSPFNLD